MTKFGTRLSDEHKQHISDAVKKRWKRGDFDSEKMKTKIWYLLLALVVLVLLVGCGPDSQTQRDQQVSVVPTPQVNNYIERENIAKRQTMFDNPGEQTWIYCLSFTGQIVFFGDVKGKVTSSGKRLEPVTSTIATVQGDIYTDEVRQIDGTFGSSDLYVYWWDSNGIYHQWNGQYFLTDQPITMNSPVILTRQVNP